MTSELFELTLLVIAAFFSGFVDAVVGGGGLIQLPALFTILPQHSAPTLFGTNKISSVFGTTSAAFRYARRVKMPWRTVITAAIFAFIFSYIGAKAVAWLSKDLLRPMILVLLIFSAIYVFRRKEFGSEHRPLLSGKKELGYAALLGLVIGLYDGFFGPGVGSFLILLFIRFFGFDFLHASAASKFVNMITNIAALAYFVPHGFFLPVFAFAMAVSNVGGSMLGTQLALRHGSTFVRKLFLVMVCLLITKFAWDTFKF